MVRVNTAAFNNIVPETIVPALPFIFKSKEHMRKCSTARSASRSWRRWNRRASSASPSTTAARAPSTPPASRSRRLADVKGMKMRVQQSDMWVSMMQSHGRQPDADALCRGLHRAEDRRGRRGGEQLAVLRILAPLRGRQDLQPDRAFDGAGAAGVLQGGLGHAAARKSRTSSARPPRNRCPICASCGTSAKQASRKRSRPAAPPSSATSTARASSTPPKPVYDKFAADPKLQDLIKQMQATE